MGPVSHSRRARRDGVHRAPPPVRLDVVTHQEGPKRAGNPPPVASLTPSADDIAMLRAVERQGPEGGTFEEIARAAGLAPERAQALLNALVEPCLVRQRRRHADGSETWCLDPRGRALLRRAGSVSGQGGGQRKPKPARPAGPIVEYVRRTPS